MEEQCTAIIEPGEMNTPLPSPKETLTAKKAPNKFIILGIALLVLVITVVLIFVLTSDMRKYKKAMELIEEQEYEEAYEILNEIERYKPAKEALKHFHYVACSEKATFLISETIVYPSECKIIYGENGLPKKIVNNGTATTFKYDEDGRLIQRIENGVQIYTYTYDKWDNLIAETFTYDSQESIIASYKYDKNNNLIEVVRPDSTDYGYEIIESYFYDEDKKIKCVKSYSNGQSTTTEYIYNESNQLIKEVNTFGYDSSSTDNNVSILLNTDPDSIEYYYNAKGQIIKSIAKYSNENDAVNTYEYDSHGNLIKIDISGGFFGIQAQQYEFEYMLVYIPYDDICEPVSNIIFITSMNFK